MANTDTYQSPSYTALLEKQSNLVGVSWGIISIMMTGMIIIFSSKERRSPFGLWALGYIIDRFVGFVEVMVTPDGRLKDAELFSHLCYGRV